MITPYLIRFHIGQGTFDSRRRQNCQQPDGMKCSLEDLKRKVHTSTRIVSPCVMAWRQVQICSLNYCKKCPPSLSFFLSLTVSHFRLEIDFLIRQKGRYTENTLWIVTTHHSVKHIHFIECPHPKSVHAINVPNNGRQSVSKPQSTDGRQKVVRGREGLPKYTLILRCSVLLCSPSLSHSLSD